jgi:hypothetical protein
MLVAFDGRVKDDMRKAGLLAPTSANDLRQGSGRSELGCRSEVRIRRTAC